LRRELDSVMESDRRERVEASFEAVSVRGDFDDGVVRVRPRRSMA
jgi:hypothetical protein